MKIIIETEIKSIHVHTVFDSVFKTQKNENLFASIRQYYHCKTSYTGNNLKVMT